jgi:hypothetical protein
LDTKTNLKYSVYVIGLKLGVLSSKKFRAANPGYQDGKPCYYVGSTYLSPEERAEQHRSGHRLCNSFARDYFDGLRRSKFRNNSVFEFREDAEKAEKQLAEKLRGKGFGVWQN